jgi:peptidoglycan LD-endopeptidase LytH
MRCLKRFALLGLLPLLALAGACVTMPFLDPRYYELLSQPPPQALPVPVVGVAKGRLRDSYGDPRSGGRQHEGIDIFAQRNTPVLSATEGYVSGLGTNALGGITVWITGPAGWHHYYAHLERWGDVRQGQWVEAGTVIGYVGNSGNAATASPHLHYGIYPPTGGTLNPYPLLAAGPGPVLARQAGSMSGG